MLSYFWPTPDMNIFVAVSIMLALAPISMMVFAIIRGFEDTILCMECQQCVAGCPVKRALGEEYYGPKNLMTLARANHKIKSAEGRIFSCTSCVRCTETCPRALYVKHTMDKYRGVLFKENLGVMDGHKKLVENVRKYRNVLDPDRKKPPLDSVVEKVKEQVSKQEMALGLVEIPVVEEAK